VGLAWHATSVNVIKNITQTSLHWYSCRCHSKSDNLMSGIIVKIVKTPLYIISSRKHLPVTTGSYPIVFFSELSLVSALNSSLSHPFSGQEQEKRSEGGMGGRRLGPPARGERAGRCRWPPCVQAGAHGWGRLGQVQARKAQLRPSAGPARGGSAGERAASVGTGARRLGRRARGLGWGRRVAALLRVLD
jgi:hypothetical protein